MEKTKRRERLALATFLVVLIGLLALRIASQISYSPASQNTVSISAGVQLVTQQANRVMIHACESSSGWTNISVTTMSFSTDTENKTQGLASVKTTIDFGVASVMAFRSDFGLQRDISDKDFVDWEIRTNGTIGQYYFILYDSSGRNLYWNIPELFDESDFTLFQLDLSNTTFQHASFDFSDVSYIAFQCAGAGWLSIWTDSISTSNYQHTYTPSYSDSYRNVTFSSGVLRLSKDTDAYEISSSTTDRISISISRWFYGSNYQTTFRPTSQVESSLSFSVNTRERGQPALVTGVTSWSYDSDTSIVSLICASGASVSFIFYSTAEAQTAWVIENIPLWMGLAGFGMLVFSPVISVAMFKSGEWEYGFIVLMFGLAIGASFIIGWLWS